MAKDKVIEKALKDGVISKKQYDKLPDSLLLGIAKSKGKKNRGTKEERHKLGKQAHKAGRPKKGSKVEISK